MKSFHIVLLTAAVGFGASFPTGSFAHGPLHGSGSSHHPTVYHPARDHRGANGAPQGGVTVTTRRDHRGTPRTPVDKFDGYYGHRHKGATKNWEYYNDGRNYYPSYKPVVHDHRN